MRRSELLMHLDQLLQPKLFKDYCPNGLQIEGKDEITTVISGVSLNQELIEIAIAKNADAIIVHHGVFWNKSDYPIVGINYQRISKLIKHDLNLFAYHLPLDNHAEVGNNIQLAQLLGIMPRGQCDDQNLLWYGDLPQAIEFNELAALYYQQTGHQPRAVGAPGKIQQIAWCTGGADSMFNAAIELGVDCFITGEISEPVYHLAHESKVGFLAGGHYVTERYGIMALTEQLKHWGLNAEFIEIYNPI